MTKEVIAFLVIPALLFCEHTLAQKPGSEIQKPGTSDIILEETEQDALEFILSQFEQGHLLPKSFYIPEDDPWYGDLVNVELDPYAQIGTNLQVRSWIYDAAMVTIVLAATAENNSAHLDTAAGILKQLRTFSVTDVDPEPGTIEFSYQIKTIEGASPAGSIGHSYLRSGAIAWVGYACTFLLRTPGFDTTHPDYVEILDFAYEIAGFIADLQVLNPRDAFGDGARFGSVKGGRGNYNLLNWNFEDSPVAWVSTEHNIDIYFFLRDLHHITGDERIGLRAELVRRSLLENHWLPPVCSDPGDPNCPCEHRGRFQQGVADPFRALDLFTWGSIFLKAIGRTAQAEILLDQVACGFIVQQDAVTIDTTVTGHRNGIDIQDSYNNTYQGVGPFSGAKPYLLIPDDTNWTAFNYFNGFDPEEIPPYPEDPPWPDMIWTEGEAGRALAVRRVSGVGQDFNDIAYNLRAIQDLDPLGGLLYTTRTQGALSFHAWPSVTCSAWQIIALAPVDRFWDGDTEVSPLPDPIFVPLTYGTDEHLTPQGRPIDMFGNGGIDDIELASDGHALRFRYDLREEGTFSGVWFNMGSAAEPFDPSQFTHIELEVWGEGSAPHVKIDRFVSGNSVEGTEYPWPGGPLSGTRTLVRIPLTVFTDVTPETDVHQFVLLYPSDSSGMSGTLWIDNIAFLRDEDVDEIPEWWEDLQFVDDPSGDPDGDGVTNLTEYRVGTNPHRSDSDFDGLPDGWELEHGLDPADGTGDNGACGDLDGDGVTNLDEYLKEQGLGGQGQCFPIFSDGFESGDLSAWSSAVQ